MKRNRSQSLLRWALTLAYAAGIFSLSSRPWTGVQLFPMMDKAIHLAIYAGLGALCFWALSASVHVRAWQLLLASAAIAFVYGVSDEYHQLFVPGRNAEVLDAVADALGGTAGALIALALSRRRAQRGEAAR